MKSDLIGVLNYTTSNSRSLVSALEAINASYIIAKDFKELILCDKIIIPGVGNAKSFFEENPGNIIKEQILHYLNNGGLIYGICLGMQILLEHSSEGDTKMLGLIPGKVISLKSQFTHELNVGHNELIINNNSQIMKDLFYNINSKERFYFLHKYFCININDEYVTAYSKFKNNSVISLLNHKNIIASQFHPELSGDVGLRFLKNFTFLNIK
jgi:glutamine amidotransferase